MISRGFAGLPPHGRGQRIGLFGGSFNPPHDGHRAASLIALHRLELDWIWWLVTPGNPLKEWNGLPPIAERMVAARLCAAHPKIIVTTFEAQLGSRYTYDLVQALVQRCPTVRFVWIMGADSFASFPLWKRWQGIADLVPLAVVDRPGFTLRATQTRAAALLRGARLGEAAAAQLPDQEPPAYVFLHGPRSSLSSTELRDDRRGDE